jgi:hypothetical protein
MTKLMGFDRLSPNGVGLLGKLRRGYANDRLSLNRLGSTIPSPPSQP